MSYDLRSVAPALCRLMGVKPPKASEAPVFDQVIQKALLVDPEGVFQRGVVFNPDAIGKQLYEHYRDRFEIVERIAPVKIELRSIFPPKTPVCFASMYSGSSPEIHGIRRYEKPVLQIDTVFDALSRSGIKTAIVAVKDSSVDMIFRERQVDYFSEKYDKEVVERTIALLERSEHEFIVSYQQEYDDTLHRTQPESPEALKAMENHIHSFSQLAEAMHSYWRDYSRFVLFGSDHGGHVDEKTGRGDHGLDIPEDMDLMHFWGFFPKGG